MMAGEKIVHAEDYKGFHFEVIRIYAAATPYDFQYGWVLEQGGKCVCETPGFEKIYDQGRAISSARAEIDKRTA
jgi:hypothetical protein